VCFFLQEICRESYKTCVKFFQSFFRSAAKFSNLGGWVGGWEERDSHSPRLALGALFFRFGGAGGDFATWRQKKMAVQILCFLKNSYKVAIF